MKFLKWVFNIESRHYGDIKRYEKGKIGTRIFVILLLFGFVGASLALEYWGLNLFKTNIFYGFLALLFLFIPVALLTIEFCVVYSYIGFRMFIEGTLADIVEKLDKKNKKKQSNKIEIDKNTVVDTDKTLNARTKSEKTRKWMDLFVGILGIVLAICLIALIVVVFAYLTK